MVNVIQEFWGPFLTTGVSILNQKKICDKYAEAFPNFQTCPSKELETFTRDDVMIETWGLLYIVPSFEGIWSITPFDQNHHSLPFAPPRQEGHVIAHI